MMSVPLHVATTLALPRFLYAFEPGRAPIFEDAIPPEAWAAAEVRVGDLRAWPAELFARPAGRRWATHPVKIGHSMNTTNDKGRKLTVMRVKYVPMSMPK